MDALCEENALEERDELASEESDGTNIVVESQPSTNVQDSHLSGRGSDGATQLACWYQTFDSALVTIDVVRSKLVGPMTQAIGSPGGRETWLIDL